MMYRRYFQHLLLLLPALFLLASCNRQPKTASTDSPPPTAVSVYEVAAQPVPIEFEYPARIVGRKEVNIQTQVTAVIEKRLFTEGNEVSAGQVLFQLDSASLLAKLQQAQAELQTALRQQEQAQRQWQRYQPLVDTGAVPQKDIDDAHIALQSAKSNVAAQQARVKALQIERNFTEVKSPVRGMVGRSLVAEGNLALANQTILTTVTDIKTVYVLFSMPDNDQSRIQQGADDGTLTVPKHGRLTARIKLRDGSVYAHSGVVDFADTRVNPSTGTSEMRAELANPDQKLRPGQFVKVILSGVAHTNAVTIPQRAVLDGPAGKFVYVVSNKSTAEARPVRLEDWKEGIWVVGDGLNSGEKVIVDGLMKIAPGAPVSISSPK